MPREWLEAKMRGLEGGEYDGPGNTGWVEDVIDGAFNGRGQINELDDALGSVVDREPRDAFVELGKDPDGVCTLVRSG